MTIEQQIREFATGSNNIGDHTGKSEEEYVIEVATEWYAKGHVDGFLAGQVAANKWYEIIPGEDPDIPRHKTFIEMSVHCLVKDEYGTPEVSQYDFYEKAWKYFSAGYLPTHYQIINL